MQLWIVVEIKMWLAERNLTIYIPTKDTQIRNQKSISKEEPTLELNNKLKDGEKEIRAGNGAFEVLSI